MTKANKFSPEVRERAVRMVLEHRGQYPSQDRCITSFANFQYALVQKSGTAEKLSASDAGTRRTA